MGSRNGSVNKEAKGTAKSFAHLQPKESLANDDTE